MRTFTLALTFLCTCGLAPLNAQFTLGLEGGIGYGTFNSSPTIATPTTEPASEERLSAVGGDALALHLGYAPADKKIGYGLRLQYLQRGYQHVYVERLPGIVGFRDELTSEVGFLDLLPSVTYHIGRRWSLGGGPYYSIAVHEKNTPDNLSTNQNLHQQDYGAHLNGRFSFGRFSVWMQYQHSLRDFDLAAFSSTYPSANPVEDPSPVSVIIWGIGFQLIR